MTNFETLLARHSGTGPQSAFATWERAHELFDEQRYREAAVLLEGLVERSAETESDGSYAPVRATGAASARLLLARAYYHSAQVGRAIETAHAIIEDDPGEAYAHLLLGRALERAGRADEAAGHRNLAEAMGA